MKNNLTFILLTLIILIGCKKNESETEDPINTEPNFSTFDGSIWKNDNSTIVTSDNNLIISGNANYDNNWTLIKITKSGDELWRSDFPSDDLFDNGCALTQADNDDLYIIGSTHRNVAQSNIDLLLYKTSPDGDTLWSKTYGTDSHDYGQNIINTSDGNILISGGTGGTDSIPPGDIYLLKINYDGDTLWTKTYEDQSQKGARHLLETHNGEYLITGSSQNNDNPNEIYLLKVDADGTKVWDKKIGSSTGKYGHSTIELSNNNLVICGYHSDGTQGNKNSQVLVIKTDNLGNTIWEQEYGEDNTSEIGNSIKQNSDGSYTLTGSSRENDTDYDDIILLKLDQAGNQVWLKKFGGTETDRGRNLIKDTNDDNLITGDFGWSGPIFLTRTDKDGNFK